MAHILVVEDEPDLQAVLEYNLRQAGHQPQLAGTGAAGLNEARQHRPDLVLLDLMLPDISGLEVCRQLRGDSATRGVPIIMLTARGEEIDRVVGFEVGADDYVTKPFSVRELLLRIQAVLRRTGEPAASEAAGGELRFGVLHIDRDAHRVWVTDRHGLPAGEARLGPREREVPLTALEFRLLCTLHDRRDRVQSRATLLDDVWGLDGDLTTRTVDTHIKRLREKLGTEAGAYIETVRGVGYRFLASPPTDRP